MAQTCACRGSNGRLARTVRVDSQTGRMARKHREFSHRAADYFAIGGGVTTAVIFRIMPSDLLKT